jgi:flagellar hook assembly protein FlgD
VSGEADVAIYDVSGREVRRLEHGDLPAGEERMRWDGKDDRGIKVSPGLYLARVDATRLHAEAKVLLLD